MAEKQQKGAQGKTPVRKKRTAPKNSSKKSGGAKLVNKQPAKQTKKNIKSTAKRPAGKNAKARKSAGKHYTKNNSEIKISFLGGLNEIGKNFTLYEYEGDMFIVDCGLAFPDTTMLGVDAVLPDFTYVSENADKIKGIVVTHGHGDHIGAIPYLLKEINIPVFSTRLTIELIKCKLKEHGILQTSSLNVVKPGEHIKLGKFDIEFIHVNHSIPDAVALAIRTGAGTVVQTGDFKIDMTPVDQDVIDLARFSEIGKEGVLALLQDSTNAEKEGYTLSESRVGESFETLFRGARNKRIIVATFASNVHRIQQILDLSRRMGRRVSVLGRSMENVVEIGQKFGYLNVPENLLVPQEHIKNYPDEKMVLITTGSQGEPMAALSKMALGEHRKVEIGPNDRVIISATPIPGNEKGVGNVVNALMMLGADVVYENMHHTHVSGHACREELKLMLNFIKPKYFIPVHGEQKHLRKHAQIALDMGMEKSSIIIADNGEKYSISNKGIKLAEKVPAGLVFVDGSGVGDVGNVVLRDRSRLASEGLVAIVATIDKDMGDIIAGPEFISRGFIYMKDNEEIISQAKDLAFRDIEKYLTSGGRDMSHLNSVIRENVSHLMYKKTKRNPMVLSFIMEV